jgi:hypothetical protein
MFSPEMLAKLGSKLPEKKQETLSIAKKRGVVAPKGGPLSKNKKQETKPVSAIPTPPVSFDPRNLNDLYANLTDPAKGGELSQRLYDFPVPTSPQQDNLLSFAKKAALSGYGRDEEQQMYTDNKNRMVNMLTQQEALKNYLAKANDPYRGINLEETAKLGAALFGGEVAPLQNRPDGMDEFKVFAAAAGNKQAYEKDQSKEAADLLGAMLRPVVTGETSKENRQFNPNVNRGPAAKEVRGTEMQKYLQSSSKAQEVAEKAEELDKIMDEYKRTPITNIRKMAEIRSRFNSVRGSLELRVKELEGFGANYTGIERELGGMNIPDSFETFAAKTGAGLYDKGDTLKAFGQGARARAERDRSTAKVSFTRPGEAEFINTYEQGNAKMFQEGKINKATAPVNEKVNKALQLMKDRKK